MRLVVRLNAARAGTPVRRRRRRKLDVSATGREQKRQFFNREPAVFDNYGNRGAATNSSVQNRTVFLSPLTAGRSETKRDDAETR